MAMKVLVMSDTHGVVRPDVREYLKNCDCIVHAGDFADEETLDDISQYARLYSVRGNNDWWSTRLQRANSFQIEGVRFFLVHDIASLPHRLSDIDVVIYGHSHRYYYGTRYGVTFLNPGSCGRRRFGGGLSLAMMRIDGRNFSVEKIELSIR